MDALKEQGRGAGGARHSLTSPFVVAQIALSVVLVVGAGLFVQTFRSLLTRDVGFDRDPVLLVTLDLRRSRADDEAKRAELYQRLADAAAEVPGVERAAASLLTPMSGMGWNSGFEIPGQPQLSERQRLAFINAVTPGWLTVYGTQLLAGRDFTRADRAGGPEVVIVNEAFVGKFLRPGAPLGQVVQGEGRPGDRPPPMEVVGVVKNAAYGNLREEIPPTIFIPMAQSDSVFPSGAVSVRTSLEPMSLARTLTAALTKVDPDVAIAIRPLSDQVAGRMVRERVMAMLGGFFGLLALLLSAVGLFGVTSYAVNLRRAEIGVRMALGADVTRVLRLVLGRSTRLVAMGVAIGVGLSVWLSKFVGSLLYGLEPRDTPTLVSAIVVMLVIGTAAAFIPAWRAARIAPVEVLREG
jgi:predicted permease